MMLGIAASISMAVPSGRRSHTGESSVRKMAMPKLTGMAMRSAIAEVTSVPTMGTSAPNFSCTGSHSSVQRKAAPNSLSDSVLPISSDTRIAASRLKTTNAKNRVRLRKIASINALLRSMDGRRGPKTTIAGSPAIVLAALLPSTALMRGRLPFSVQRLAGAVGHALPGGLDLLHDRLGHRHVVELARHRRAVFERPLEELENFLAVLGLLLLGVHQDERGA